MLDRPSHRLDTCPVAGMPWFHPVARPAPVAIHDDSNMNREARIYGRGLRHC
jgi:hypothetical protein